MSLRHVVGALAVMGAYTPYSLGRGFAEDGPKVITDADRKRLEAAEAKRKRKAEKRRGKSVTE